MFRDCGIRVSGSINEVGLPCMCSNPHRLVFILAISHFIRVSTAYVTLRHIKHVKINASLLPLGNSRAATRSCGLLTDASFYGVDSADVLRIFSQEHATNGALLLDTPGTMQKQVEGTKPGPRVSAQWKPLGGT